METREPDETHRGQESVDGAKPCPKTSLKFLPQQIKCCVYHMRGDPCGYQA